MTRCWTVVLGVIVAAVFVLAPAAAPDRRPPRIVAATMLDIDRDALADRVRLTYSERIRHAADRDGRYPFAVQGYRIRSVGKATGNALVLLLTEPAKPDTNATPTIRYRRTSSKPVRDRAGNQARAQLFARTKAHGHTLAAQPAPSPPAPADADADGTPDAGDCAPRNAAVHPGAPDLPDLEFVDSNCDGIDGTERDAVFVSPDGDDANPGTRVKPKRWIQAAVEAARTGNGRYVLVAFGKYTRFTAASGIGIYGGYDPSSWTRQDRFPDGLPSVSGSPDAVLADGAKNVVLQHLRIRGLGGQAGSGDRSTYGIRALGNADLTLQRVALSALDGAPGDAGIPGRAGQPGGAGGSGVPGSCDGANGVGGRAGSSVAGRPGGRGGIGGHPHLGGDDADGGSGKVGEIDTPGGAGGDSGNPGKPGGKGGSGENGTAGPGGGGGQGSAANAARAWVGQNGSGGGQGAPGDGGGGGGGGGSQQGTLVNNGGGNGGGGGGGGGEGGTRGAGGGFGGGSFGLYLFNAKVVVEDSTVEAGNGGAGGRGGDGGLGGAGGAGGKGGKVCTSEVGAGGDGGFGGAGGRGGGGGGGAGGPSIGIFKGGTATAVLRGSKVTAGTAGPGGAGGNSGPAGRGTAGVPGIANAIHP